MPAAVSRAARTAWSTDPTGRVWENARMAHSFADISPGIALTPLDGRYRAQIAPLVDHLSEAALNRTRLEVETEWMIHLLDSRAIPGLRDLTDAEREYVVEAISRWIVAEYLPKTPPA